MAHRKETILGWINNERMMSDFTQVHDMMSWVMSYLEPEKIDRLISIWTPQLIQELILESKRDLEVWLTHIEKYPNQIDQHAQDLLKNVDRLADAIHLIRTRVIQSTDRDKRREAFLEAYRDYCDMIMARKNRQYLNRPSIVRSHNA